MTIRKNPFYSDGEPGTWGWEEDDEEELILGPPEPTRAPPYMGSDPVYEQNINQARSSGQYFWRKVKQSMEDDNV